MDHPVNPGAFAYVLVVAFGLMAMSDNATADSKSYKRIPVKLGEPPPAALSQFIGTLQKATEAGDVSVIFKSVSEDFQCVRDFGGACNERMTPREKLSAITGIESEAGGDRNYASLAALGQLLEAKYYALTTGRDAMKTPLLCGPVAPEFDEKVLAEIDKKIFGGDGESFWFEWLAIGGENVPVRSKPDATSLVLEKLSLEMVHADNQMGSSDGWIAVDLPSGAKGYVRQADVVTLLPEQLCFTEHPSKGWQISGFVGGGD